VASTPIACPRETTDKRRTTTTNSSSSHHQDSAPSRPHSLICTGAEPIHPVHASSQLCRAAVAPRNEIIFLPFWRGFLHLFSNVLHRRRRISPRRTMYLLIVGLHYCVMRFAYALHMRQQNFFPFPCVYIELFELVIEVYVAIIYV